MLRSAALVFLISLLPAGLPAQPPDDPAKPETGPDTGPPEVQIMLRAGTPRELLVGPRGAGLCPGKRGCDDTITFVWVGARNEGEEIVVAFDDPLVAEACFGATGVTLTGIGVPNARSLTATDGCVGKRALFYTVSCAGGEGGDCGGVVPVDPGVIVDGGGT